ncbi:MAG: hypothetical protein LC778_10365 [Acidobacteria bacterium]|nr:hypothetical protein [Acidobacteriota bacterium]
MALIQDMRALTIESEMEDRTRTYLDKKARGQDTKTIRGIVRGLAIAIVVLRDPDDVSNEDIIKAVEAEFKDRVSD